MERKQTKQQNQDDHIKKNISLKFSTFLVAIFEI